MRDLFARWATRATGATEPESASDDSGSRKAVSVAQPSDLRATRATKAEAEKPKQDKPFPGALPVLPMLPTENGNAVRCRLPDCLILLDDMHAGIRVDYVPGALALLDTDRDLRQRFDATEGRIDELAKEPGGPTEHDFCRALAEHAAVWREVIARYRARQEGAG